MRKGTAHDKPRQPTGELPRISPATPPAAKPGGRVPAAGKASQSRKDGWPQGMFRRTDGRFRFERMVSGTKHRFSLPFTEAVAIKTASRANELLAEGRSIEHLKKAQKVSFTKFLAEMRTLTKQKRPATRKSERARLKGPSALQRGRTQSRNPRLCDREPTSRLRHRSTAASPARECDRDMTSAMNIVSNILDWNHSTSRVKPETASAPVTRRNRLSLIP